MHYHILALTRLNLKETLSTQHLFDAYFCSFDGRSSDLFLPYDLTLLSQSIELGGDIECQRAAMVAWENRGKANSIMFLSTSNWGVQSKN